MEDLHQEPAQPEMQLQQPDAVAATEPAQNHILQADPESTGTENPASEDGQMESSNQSENVGRWTDEEHQMFLHGLEVYGKTWKKIAELIPSRTVVQIRTHAQKYFLKLHRAEQNAAKLCADSDNGYSAPMTRKRFRTRQMAAMERQAYEQAQEKERATKMRPPALDRKQSNHSEATTCSSMSEGASMMYASDATEPFEQRPCVHTAWAEPETFLGAENFEWVDLLIGDDDNDLQFDMMLENLTSPFTDMPLPFLDDAKQAEREQPQSFPQHHSPIASNAFGYEARYDDGTSYMPQRAMPQFSQQRAAQPSHPSFQQYHQPRQAQYHSQWQQQPQQQYAQQQAFQQCQPFQQQYQAPRAHGFQDAESHVEAFGKPMHAQMPHEYSMYQAPTQRDRPYMSQYDHSTSPQPHQQQLQFFQAQQPQPAQQQCHFQHQLQYQPHQQQQQQFHHLQAAPSMTFGPSQDSFDDAAYDFLP